MNGINQYTVTFFFIQDVPKMLGLTSGVSFPHQKGQEFLSFSFRGAGQRRVDPFN
jgi:hypothetical protein